ncbi:ABC transporter, substrate-binding protein like protein, partial [Aduncisulcus paluster]
SYMHTLLGNEPDLIFASPTPAAIVAKQITQGTNIPVIFAPVNDPVAAGIVKNERAPEGNITGVRLSASDGRRLQYLKDVVPTVSKVLVPFSLGDKSAAASVKMLERLLPSDKEYMPADVDAVLLPREGLVMSRINDFVTVCLERKLPLSTPRFKQVEDGALTGYGFNGYEIGRQSARMAHMLFSGAPVSSLPV